MKDPQMSTIQTVTGVVSSVDGHPVTQVGFRAMVLKNAIRWNLAGSAVNNSCTTSPPTVSLVLQGYPDAIQAAKQQIMQGTKLCPTGNFAIQWTDPVDGGNLTVFKVQGWTSSTRHINTPYNLLYFVNPDPQTSVLDAAGASACYRQILFYCVTDPDDRAKIDKASDMSLDD